MSPADVGEKMERASRSMEIYIVDVLELKLRLSSVGSNDGVEVVFGR